MKLPPYGSPSVQLDSPSNSRPMESWKKSDSDFVKFINEIGDEIEDFVWPSFNTNTKSWEGNSTKFAENASFAENEICFNHLQSNGMLTRLPESPDNLKTYGTLDHKWHYEVEDFIETRPEGTPQIQQDCSSFPTANFHLYDNSVDPLAMRGHFISNFRKKYQGTFQLKLRFRRPRPQQVAFIAGDYNFKFHQARSYTHTGNHPSLISGHCAQGLLLMGGYLEDRLKTEQLSSIDLEAISQFAADFGDRRVFAGVHFPSDNVCSWIMCLRLAREVFDDPDLIQEIFMKAITEKSHVYKLITNEYQKYPSLHPLLDFLRVNINSVNGIA